MGLFATDDKKKEIGNQQSTGGLFSNLDDKKLTGGLFSKTSETKSDGGLFSKSAEKAEPKAEQKEFKFDFSKFSKKDDDEEEAGGYTFNIDKKGKKDSPFGTGAVFNDKSADLSYKINFDDPTAGVKEDKNSKGLKLNSKGDNKLGTMFDYSDTVGK